MAVIGVTEAYVGMTYSLDNMHKEYKRTENNQRKL